MCLQPSLSPKESCVRNEVGPCRQQQSPSSLMMPLVGYSVVLIHLILIATTFIDPLSAHATGTLTVHSWLFGWLLAYKYGGGLDNKWVRMEAAILLCSLFQLAVGAFAFSRYYYGPMMGHEKDLFQSLSILYLRENEWIPSHVMEWWELSSQQRFVGLGWYVCEIADILTHQIPFVLLCYIITRNSGGWKAIAIEMRKVWHVAALSGTVHRLLWDVSTCGHYFCDGPYRGFLKEIAEMEQFFWHFVPCITMASYLSLRRRLL
uniref:EXPERA domain-containing protein n=1 Tax=Helicotheca tamesis TaxID=374047 RepID=A0A7S2N1K0_9STRA|mmetsp:Transcript_7925/g.10913  ORF Transcript_7925/g.10913 Transcript_7925/m.10913 type:complete len:262 (+) Transcript_7925:110-895(+)